MGSGAANLARARSLARSYLRLQRTLEVCQIKLEQLPSQRGKRLQRELEVLLRLLQLLENEPLSAQDTTEIARVLEAMARTQKELQEELFVTLEPDLRQRVRLTMLRVTVTDEELAEQLAQLEEATQGESGSTRGRTRGKRPRPAAEQSAADAWLPQEIAETLPELGMELSPEELDEISSLIGPLLGLLDPEEILAQLEVDWRKEQEDKTISLSVELQAALRSLPAVWIEAMHQTLRLPPRRRKLERIEAIIATLRDGTGLSRLVRRLRKEEQEALSYLLDNGGWQLTGPFCRRFGADDRDGWFWMEDAPTSVLGRLRLHSLVFVGKARVNRRRCRVAVVAEELREPLKVLLVR